MNIDWTTARVYLKPGATDMRKQMRTLSVYVAEDMKHNALTGVQGHHIPQCRVTRIPHPRNIAHRI